GPVPGQAVDVGRLETGVGDGPLGRVGADLAGGAPGGLRVRALAHAGDRRAAGNVLEGGSVAPVRTLPHRSVNVSERRKWPERTGSDAPRRRCWGPATPG